LAVILPGLAHPQAAAATMLFDFETGVEVEVVSGPMSVARAGRFAASGSHSLRVGLAAGSGGYPSAGARPSVTDWSAYDRVVWEVTNPTPYHVALDFYVTDGNGQFSAGLADLPPFSRSSVEGKIGALTTRGINTGDIRSVRWLTDRPEGEVELYVDRVMLLAENEARPALPASYLNEFTALQEDYLAFLRGEAAAARAEVGTVAGAAPAVAGWASGALDVLDNEINAFAAKVQGGGPDLLELNGDRLRLRDRLLQSRSLARLATNFAPVQPGVIAPDAVRADVVAAFATSMQKVLPKRPGTMVYGSPGITQYRDPDWAVGRQTSLALARNETEAFQVIVLPGAGPMTAASVRVGELKGPGGAILPAMGVTSSVMGYVRTENVPPYGTPHVGWWPDPILDFMKETDIARGDAQSFWVSVRAPRNQTPGTYSGRLEVLENGRPLYVFDLSVEVYPFAMPARSPLDMAVSWRPFYHESDGQGGWREGPYRDESWKQHKLAWADFLADHYLGYDFLYQDSLGDFDFEMIEHLHRQGRLGRFNLAYWDPVRRSGDGTGTPGEFEAWKAEKRQRIGAAYDKARDLGILGHAYIYGADELPMTWAPGIEQAAAFLKQEYPGPTILTTTYDRSYGTSSLLPSVDAFSPLTQEYNPELAAAARAAGKKVWWYICSYPLPAFANSFIEYAGSEMRVLMGAQTTRFRPDGFLMYQTAIWNSPPITNGPFTSWNPASFKDWNGDGSWTCPGPDGKPLTTIRLENFRDGVEDHAYALLLEEALRQVEASAEAAAKAAWRQNAKDLLAVPSSLVQSTYHFNRDPAEVQRWRRNMAEAIMASGIPPAALAAEPRSGQNFNLLAGGDYPYPGTPLSGWNASPQVNGLIPGIVDAGGGNQAFQMDSFGGGAATWALGSTAVLPASSAGWTYAGTAKWTATRHPSLPHYGVGGLLLSSGSNGTSGNNWIWVGYSRGNYDNTGKSWSGAMLEYSLGGTSGSVPLGGPAFRDFPEHAPIGLTVTRNGGTITLTIATPLDGALVKSHTFAGAQAAALDTLRFAGAMTYFSVFQYDDLNVVSGPLISATGTPAALNTTYGTASAPTSFTVSGLNMGTGILVTAPDGFEVSTDNAGFAPTVTVGSAGTIAASTVYLRLAANATAGAKSGAIALTSSGADAVNVAATTSTVGAKTLTGSFTAAGKIYDGTTTATVTGRFLTGIVGSDAVSLSGGTAAFADAAVGAGKTVTLTGATLSGARAANYTLGPVATTTADITTGQFSENFEGYARGNYPFPANSLPGWKYMFSNDGLLPGIIDTTGNQLSRSLKMNSYGGGASGWMSVAHPLLAAAAPDWSVSADVRWLKSNHPSYFYYGFGGLLLSSNGDLTGDYLWLGPSPQGPGLNPPAQVVMAPGATGMLGGAAVPGVGGAWFYLSSSGGAPAKLTVSRTKGSPGIKFVIASPDGGPAVTNTLAFTGAQAAALDNLRYVGFANYFSEWEYDNLAVTTSLPTPPVETWLEGAPLNAENLFKYAVGGAATIQSVPQAAAGSLDAGKLSLSAIIRTDDPDLQVMAESSQNLVSWTTNGITTQASNDQTGLAAGFQRRIFSIALADPAPAKLVLRLKVVHAP